MPPQTSFAELIQRLRAGDQEAVAELIRIYGDEIRTFIRQRLVFQRFRRTVDVSDIFQSVFAAFYVRVVTGQYDLDEPEQLTRLLVTMASNKIKNHARKAANRKAAEVGPGFLDAVTSPEQKPSDIIAFKELLERVHGLLSNDERSLADQRASGMRWADIAAGLGEQPDTVRKRFERALDRVCRELGIEMDHE
jgi:RNA polymerase sigma factor (sigma-70 family)